MGNFHAKATLIVEHLCFSRQKFQFAKKNLKETETFGHPKQFKTFFKFQKWSTCIQTQSTSPGGAHWSGWHRKTWWSFWIDLWRFGQALIANDVFKQCRKIGGDKINDSNFFNEGHLTSGLMLLHPFFVYKLKEIQSLLEEDVQMDQLFFFRTVNNNQKLHNVPFGTSRFHGNLRGLLNANPLN